MQPLPPGFRSIYVDCDEVRLHAVTNDERGPDGQLADPRPAIILLHGFPEFWAGWRPVMEHLGRDFLLIAPDQRGYNLSDAPEGLEAYRPKLLVADILALADRLLGNRTFLLCGHDWGASIAYALAIGAPRRLNGLVIVNGVHPVCFQRALLGDPAQMAASQYFHVLRAPEAASRLAEDGYRRLIGMFEKFSATPWLTDVERADYVEAWSRPGRLEAMLNWYRASPIIVPKPGEPVPDAPLASAPAEKFTVTVPHLLVWGERDEALRPSSHSGLGEFAPKLRRAAIAEGDHWVIHTHGGRVASEIAAFARELNR